jgi:hypothetical protein
LLHYEKIDLKDTEPTIIIPTSSSSLTFSVPLTYYSGVVYYIYDLKKLATSNLPSSDSLTSIIELENSEVEKAFTQESLLAEILKNKGFGREEAEDISKALLEYVTEKVNERQLKLSDDVKRIIANLMALIAVKLAELGEE